MNEKEFMSEEANRLHEELAFQNLRELLFKSIDGIKYAADSFVGHKGRFRHDPSDFSILYRHFRNFEYVNKILKEEWDDYVQPCDLFEVTETLLKRREKVQIDCKCYEFSKDTL